MKKLLNLILVFVLITSLSVSFSSCSDKSSKETVSQEEQLDESDIPEEIKGEDYDNGISFDEEEEEANIIIEKAKTDKFIGKWKATSGQAMYLYGNINLNIKAGGKWTGNIADEDMSGTWKENSEGIALTSEFFDCELAYTEDNVLIMRYLPDGDTEYVNTVLSKE